MFAVELMIFGSPTMPMDIGVPFNDAIMFSVNGICVPMRSLPTDKFPRGLLPYRVPQSLISSISPFLSIFRPLDLYSPFSLFFLLAILALLQLFRFYLAL